MSEIETSMPNETFYAQPHGGHIELEKCWHFK